MSLLIGLVQSFTKICAIFIFEPNRSVKLLPLFHFSLNSDERKTFFAEVILPLSVPGTFTYRVPHDMNSSLEKGMRVVVPFGKKRHYVGILLSFHEQAPREYTAKYISYALDPWPLLQEVHLQFWLWISSYYLCYPGDVMQAALPSGLKLQSESKIAFHPDRALYEGEMDTKELRILEILEEAGEVPVSRIVENENIPNAYKYLNSLYKKNQILFVESLEESYKPLNIRILEISEPYRSDEAMGEVFNQLEKKAKTQLEVLIRMMSETGLEGRIGRQKLLNRENVSAAALNALIKKGIIHEYLEQKSRLNLVDEQHLAHVTLSPAQQIAYQQIVAHPNAPVLLSGITSSGKTHVYFKLIEETVSGGGQVLFMVPEIALTTQLISRITNHFGNRVVIWHSRYNLHEKVEIFQAVTSGQADIILGARSAIFLPFCNLQLVIIDEEHENAYKQFDPAPRYHARDAGIMLAHMHGARCVLGSATPSMESLWNAHQKKYQKVTLTERYGGIQLPEIELVNMAEARKSKQVNGIFSLQLLHEIKETLDRKEQVILFLNRKGYVPITECAECGWHPVCENCDISLTYYKNGNMLKCHYCGFRREPYALCPSCKSRHLEMSGYGTERAEDELQNLLPDVVIQRFDYETTRSRAAYEQIIHDFEVVKTQILIGTQMVAKGLDFQFVSLVGILNADQMLNFPDFRSSERAVQMMIQVAGRAGRRDVRGKVLIQSSRPEHAVFQYIMNNQYEDFYVHELEERHTFRYPPATRMIRLVCRHKQRDIAMQGAAALYQKLSELLGQRVLRPQSPAVSRIRNLFLQEMIIRLEGSPREMNTLKTVIRREMDRLMDQKAFKGIYVHADVDPA